MTRTLKALGVAAVAALAMSVVVASAAQANFTSANYPATATASSSADKFTAFNSTVECTENTFSGSLAAADDELTINPSYKNCVYGSFPATVNFNSCDYLFHTTTGGAPTVDVVCGGLPIEIEVFASHAAHTAGNEICILKVGSQAGLNGHTYTNNVDGTITISGTVDNISATQERKSFVCPTGTSTNEAEYAIQPGGIKVSGNNGAVSVH